MKPRFKTVVNSIKSIFHQEDSREIFTFLGFVLLAFVFWFLQGMSDKVEKTFELSVVVQNVPEGVEILDAPSTIEVKLSDRVPVMLRYRIKGIKPIMVDFQEYAKGDNALVLSQEQIGSILKKDLQPSTQILSSSPDMWQLSYRLSVQDEPLQVDKPKQEPLVELEAKQPNTQLQKVIKPDTNQVVKSDTAYIADTTVAVIPLVL